MLLKVIQDIAHRGHREGNNELVAERISNHYFVWELFWPLEFRIYIFRPMRMTDAILSGEVTRVI